METVISIFLWVLGAYFIAGTLFGFYFLIIGAAKLDPQISNSKKSVRILLFPGAVATWPLLLAKLLKSRMV